MKLTQQDVINVGGNIEELVKSIDQYFEKLDGAMNFAGEYSQSETWGSLFKAGCQLTQLELIPVDMLSRPMSWWKKFTDYSVDPTEWYWIVPRGEFMKYI